MSSIQTKIGQCEDCVSLGNIFIKPIIAGRCQYHYKIYRAKVNREKKKDRDVSNGIDRRGDSQKKQYWFESRRMEMAGRCSECSEPINKTIYKFAICSIAHVLAKRDNMYPSVKYHPENWIELGSTCGCHYKFDQSNWSELKKWKIFPILESKIRVLYPILSKQEKNKLDLFMDVPCEINQ